MGNRYLTIFTLLTPASILGIPFVDICLQKLGYHGGMQAINLLALSQGIVKVSSSNLNVQILGFVFFSFFRSFLFAVTFSFLPTILSPDLVGTGIGLMAFCTILSFINIPLADVAVDKLGRDFFVPNLVYTQLSVTCGVIAWYIEQGVKRERAVHKELDRQAELRQTMGGVVLHPNKS